MHRKVLAALIAVTTVAACGGDDDAGDSGATEPARASATTAAGGAIETTAGAEPATSGASTSDAAAADEFDEEAVFHLVRHVGATNFDPHRSPCTCDEATHTPVYERLVHLTKDAETAPGLAESWEYSEDGLVLTMTLRDDVVFHDGEPFDADAAKANLDRARELEGSTVAGALARIASVDAPDPTTLVINLSEPDAALLAQLATFPGMMVSPAAFENPDLDVMPVGAGPYRVVEHEPNNLVVYERFDEYFDPDAQHLAGIEIQVVPDPSARLNMLRAGDADAGALLSTALFQEAATIDGLVAEPKPLLSFEGLYMNRTRRPELADLHVRQAIMHAIDRNGLVTAVLNGLGEPQYQPFPRDYYAYNDEIPEDTYAFDLDKARQLMAESAYPDGFSFELVFPAYNDTAAAAVQAMLAEINITVNARAAEPSAIADEFFVRQTADAMLSTVSGHPDPQMLFQYRYMPNGRGNPGGHTTPEFQALFDQISVSVDPEAREDLIRQAVKEISDSVLEVPLYSVGAFLGPVTGPCVAQYGGGLFGSRLEEAAIEAGCR